MRIEKISDTQIRCFLNKQDLNEREVKLSELVYGSDKAKELFHEMMQQVSQEYGFDMEDFPLMIEAIPTSPESLILIITKMENPEELDVRFSNFTPYPDDESAPEEPQATMFADAILNHIDHLGQALWQQLSTELKNRQEELRKQAETTGDAIITAKVPIRKTFCLPSLDAAITLSKAVHRFYQGRNLLYQDPKSNRYYLVLEMKGASPEAFNRICNVACEYGSIASDTSMAYYEEHFRTVFAENAVAELARL